MAGDEVMEYNIEDGTVSAPGPVTCIPTLWALKDMVARLSAIEELQPTLSPHHETSLPALESMDSRIIARAVSLAIAQASYETEQRMAPEVADALSPEFGCSRGRKPSVTLEEFVLDRLLRYTRPTQQELVAALALVDRAIAAGGLALTWRTSHRLFATALIVSVKFSQDDCFRNSYYAKVAGVPLEEFNNLEVSLLSRLGFDAWVGDEELQAYASSVVALARAIAEEEARRRVNADSIGASEHEKSAKRMKLVHSSPLSSPNPVFA